MRVGLHEGSGSAAKAKAAGLRVTSMADAAREADVIMMLVPDTVQGEIYRQRDRAAPDRRQDADVRARLQHPLRRRSPRRPASTCRWWRPSRPGHRVRELYVEGAGTPALFAVHQDATGQARPLTLSYAKGIGVTRAGVLETTFAEETETDLFGEQSVLCGGTSALVKAAFETLVEAGYQPEIAYFECMHELKLIVDLMYRGGLNYMRYSVSDTAEHGDYTGGPRVVTAETKAEMKRMLDDIKSGRYAKLWMDEHAAGRPNFTATRLAEQKHPIEKVGAELRAMMPFLDPVTVKPEDQRQPVGTTGKA